MKRLSAALLHCVVASSLTAQCVDVFASLGVGAAKADTIGGVVINATIAARNTWFQLALTPVEFIAYSGVPAPLIVSDIAGENVCGNAITGLQLPRQRCVGPTALFGASGSVAVRVPGTPAFLGYGTRLSSTGTASFGTVSIHTGRPFSLPWTATAQVGGQYLAAVLSVGTQLRRRRT